jgi:hypothetical protein
MIAAAFGLAGIVFCLFVADAWVKQSGAKVAVYLAVVLTCFGIAIAGISPTPGFLDLCDEYSRFASSC